MKWAENFKANKAPKVVTDLDAIIRDPIAVTLHGKTHTIKPVLVEEFFALSNAMATVKDISNRDKITLDEVINGYYGVISAVCPTITREDIRACSHSQISAFLKIVIEHVSGGLTDEKKKDDGNAADGDDQELEPFEAAEILAEAAILFGWKPIEVLKMDAATFFKVLRHGRRIYRANRDNLLIDLCDIQTISFNAENYKIFRKHFQRRSFPSVRKALPSDDIRTAQIVAAAFKSVAPFLRGGPPRG